MNVAAVAKHLRDFAKEHKTRFYLVLKNQIKALELAATTAVAKHYESNDYTLEIINPKGARGFKVKTSASGKPWNFSRIRLTKDGTSFEVHMNLSVRGAHDEGIYCVDVAVTKPGIIPLQAPGKEWKCAKNNCLITFAEAKKLVIYPMLLAQFLGIAHEIKPAFLFKKLGSKFAAAKHLLPTLVTLGNFSGNSRKIVEAYADRKVHLQIAENFDIRLANLRAGRCKTAFYTGGLDEDFAQ